LFAEGSQLPYLARAQASPIKLVQNIAVIHYTAKMDKDSLCPLYARYVCDFPNTTANIRITAGVHHVSQ
jgi:hypothetical protein